MQALLQRSARARAPCSVLHQALQQGHLSLPQLRIASPRLYDQCLGRHTWARGAATARTAAIKTKTASPASPAPLNAAARGPARASRPAHPPSSSPPPAPAIPRGATYNPLIQQLAARPSPILIYQGDSKGSYVTGCFVLGSVCVAYALINGHTILFDPLVDPSMFVKVTFGVVCSAMFGFGCAIFYKTFRIVHSITVVPVLLAGGSRSIRLRIETGNLRSKTVDVPYDKVTASRRLFAQPRTPSAEDKLRQMQQAKERWEFQKRHILTLPFRQAGHFFAQGFRGFRRIVSDDEWIFLRVQGRRGRWKVHSTPAWALRNGKHFDELTRRA